MMKKGKRMAVIAGMATAVLANCVVGVYALRGRDVRSIKL